MVLMSVPLLININFKYSFIKNYPENYAYTTFLNFKPLKLSGLKGIKLIKWFNKKINILKLINKNITLFNKKYIKQLQSKYGYIRLSVKDIM